MSKIKIIAVGGGAAKAIEKMVSAGMNDVSFAVVGTDFQSVKESSATEKVLIAEDESYYLKIRDTRNCK